MHTIANIHWCLPMQALTLKIQAHRSPVAWQAMLQSATLIMHLQYTNGNSQSPLRQGPDDDACGSVAEGKLLLTTQVHKRLPTCAHAYL